MFQILHSKGILFRSRQKRGQSQVQSDVRNILLLHKGNPGNHGILSRPDRYNLDIRLQPRGMYGTPQKNHPRELEVVRVQHLLVLRVLKKLYVLIRLSGDLVEYMKCP